MIYFVTEAFLKLETPMADNVDTTDVMPFVKTAADMWLRNTLGTYFYRHMLTVYNAYKEAQAAAIDPTTVDINDFMTSSEQDLLMDIRPTVAWRATSNAVIELTAQLKNKGLQLQSGDNSQAVDYKTMAFVSQHYNDMAAFYENRLFEYLKENKDNWPEFMDPLNKDSDARKSFCRPTDNFQTGVFSI